MSSSVSSVPQKSTPPAPPVQAERKVKDADGDNGGSKANEVKKQAPKPPPEPKPVSATMDSRINTTA